MYLSQAFTINIKGAGAILVKKIQFRWICPETVIRLDGISPETVVYGLSMEGLITLFCTLIDEILTLDFTTILHFDFKISTLEFKCPRKTHRHNRICGSKTSLGFDYRKNVNISKPVFL